ncbi:uncharacterized protein LOC110808943 isoform X2 [Carica papaya]|nr:uncharacterized protein LOC110808943 isoform X2 [Carica papaya]
MDDSMENQKFLDGKSTRMALEDHSQKGSNSASSIAGGDGNLARSSKKQKPKKVPQRGLGVAQLEKIRLEEQQKKDAAAILPSSPSTILSQTKSPYFSVPFPGYHNPPNHPSSSCSSSSIPFSSDHSSSSSMLRPPPLLQNVDGVGTDTAPFTNSIGWSPVPLQGNANGVPKLWSPCEYNLEKESSGVDPGLACRSNLIVPYELNPIWPLPSLIQKAQQCQRAYSMVNASSATSASSSSSTQSSSLLNNFQIEPPSNQSYYSNYTSPWPEEEKMVGFKRSYPFSLDNSSGPLFDCKFPPLVHHPINKSSEQASHCNGGSVYLESGNQIFRDSLTCPTSMSELYSKQSNRESGSSNRDFLTLAPPTISNIKHISPANLGYNNHEYPDFESPPYQVSTEDSIIKQGPSQSNQQQPYFSFFPPAAKQIDPAASSSVSNCNVGEVGEGVDLNLKL